MFYNYTCRHLLLWFKPVWIKFVHVNKDYFYFRWYLLVIRADILPIHFYFWFSTAFVWVVQIFRMVQQSRRVFVVGVGMTKVKFPQIRTWTWEPEWSETNLMTRRYSIYNVIYRILSPCELSLFQNNYSLSLKIKTSSSSNKEGRCYSFLTLTANISNNFGSQVQINTFYRIINLLVSLNWSFSVLPF